jgi:multicomponent Na+:H+ antiporter subunit G
MTDVIGEAIMVLGAGFIALAAVGVHRFGGDVLARMHAATKAPTLGFLLVGVGAALRLGGSSSTVKVLLAIGLVFLTAPVGAHLVGRATYHGGTAVPDDPDESRAPGSATGQ